MDTLGKSSPHRSPRACTKRFRSGGTAFYIICVSSLSWLVWALYYILPSLFLSLSSLYTLLYSSLGFCFFSPLLLLVFLLLNECEVYEYIYLSDRLIIFALSLAAPSSVLCCIHYYVSYLLLCFFLKWFYLACSSLYRYY